MTQLSVTSAGIFKEEFQAYQVINNLTQTFKFTPEVAKALIQDGAIIRKSVTREFAEKLADRFAKQGLNVTLKVATQTDKQERQKTANSDSPFATKKTVEKLLSGDFSASKISVRYRLSFMLTLLVSLVAPIIYFAIILALFYGGFWYADFLADNLSSVSGSFLKLVTLVAPYFIITILILFLIKPLFATHCNRDEFELHRRDAPELFNLIEVMCEKIAVPFPTKICVVTDVNAWVSAMHGIASINRGELRLTIGLPLLLGLNTRELSTILAHEFGHFAQPFALKTKYFVHSINYWFTNRAYAPDSLDTQLEGWSKQADWNIAIVSSLFIAKKSILLIRILFSFLSRLNYLLTQYMSRAMEYDADSYASRFAGSDQVAKTFAKMTKYAYANQKAGEINAHAWCDENLLANLPLATIELAAQDKKTLTQFKQSIRNIKTSKMDTHPSDHDRITQLSLAPQDGIFNCEIPAKSLIKSIDKLCELATLETYKEHGIHNPKQHVIENKQLIGLDEYKKKAEQAFNTFFNETYNGRFLNLSPVINDKPLRHIDTMNAIREQLTNLKPLEDSYNQLLQQINSVNLYRSYSQAGFEVDATDFGFTEERSLNLDNFLGELNYQLVAKRNEFNHLDQLFYERIEFNKQLIGDEKQQTLQNVMKSLQAIQRLEPIMHNLKRHTFIFQSLLNVDDEDHDKVMPVINRFTDMSFSDSRQLMSKCQNIPLNDSKFTNLAKFIESWTGELPRQRQRDQIDEHFYHADEICRAIHYQYYWHFAQVSEICCQAERDNKINSLSFPPQAA